MPNSYFQFKQFRVEQAQCAMKISTDACILGSYVNPTPAQRIIDIGTGTGLLALMLAQRSTAQITAVEIEPAAAAQAHQNFQASPWASRIEIVQQAIQYFALHQKHHLSDTHEVSNKYFNTFTKSLSFDFAICNPPFFNKATLPSAHAQQVAHHTIALSFEDLWQSTALLLTTDGQFAVLLPIQEMNLFEKIGNTQGFEVLQSLTIQDSIKHKPHRKIAVFGRKTTNHSQILPSQEHLVIKDEEGNYTKEFVDLLKPYYLHL